MVKQGRKEQDISSMQTLENISLDKSTQESINTLLDKLVAIKSVSQS